MSDAEGCWRNGAVVEMEAVNCEGWHWYRDWKESCDEPVRNWNGSRGGKRSVAAKALLASLARAASFCSPDLEEKILLGSLFFPAFYFVFFLLFNQGYPGIVGEVWNLQHSRESSSSACPSKSSSSRKPSASYGRATTNTSTDTS